jgi:hypothetical protein
MAYDPRVTTTLRVRILLVFKCIHLDWKALIDLAALGAVTVHLIIRHPSEMNVPTIGSVICSHDLLIPSVLPPHLKAAELHNLHSPAIIQEDIENFAFNCRWNTMGSSRLCVPDYSSPPHAMVIGTRAVTLSAIHHLTAKPPVFERHRHKRHGSR